MNTLNIPGSTWIPVALCVPTATYHCQTYLNIRSLLEQQAETLGTLTDLSSASVRTMVETYASGASLGLLLGVLLVMLLPRPATTWTRATALAIAGPVVLHNYLAYRRIVDLLGQQTRELGTLADLSGTTVRLMGESYIAGAPLGLLLTTCLAMLLLHAVRIRPSCK